MKTYSKHTPGPWRIHGDYIRENTGTEMGGYVIAKVTEGTGWTAGDAALISAAPEMYEALKLTWEYIVKPSKTLTSEEIISIQTALDKAEGSGE